MFCEKCGRQVGDDMSFCPGCGTSLGGDSAPQMQAAPQPQVVQQQATPVYTVQPKVVVKKKRHPIAVILVIVILLGIAGTIVHFVVPGPEAVATEFIECFSEMDVNGAMECTDSKTQKQWEATMGVYDMLFSIADFGVGTDSLLSAAPFLANMEGMTIDMEVVDAYTEYSDTDNVILNEFYRLFGKEATTYLVIECDGEEETVPCPMVNEGIANWKVNLQAEGGLY